MDLADAAEGPADRVGEAAAGVATAAAVAMRSARAAAEAEASLFEEALVPRLRLTRRGGPGRATTPTWMWSRTTSRPRMHSI